MGYLICDKCNSYYKLQKGESPEDFSDECECGGKLRYTDSLEGSVALMEEAEVTKKCPFCGTENPEDSRICKSCKKLLKPINNYSKHAKSSKNTISGLIDKWKEQSNVIKGGSIVGVCCLGLILIIGIIALISPDAQPLTGAELDEYKASCIEISFAELEKNPDKYQGEHVKFTGEIVQILEENGETIIRLAVTKDEFGWSYDDIIYVVYKNETPFVEKNIVTVYGDVYGSYTYTSQIGAQISLPRINARYIEKVKDQEENPETAAPVETPIDEPENYTPTNTENYSPTNEPENYTPINLIMVLIQHLNI